MKRDYVMLLLRCVWVGHYPKFGSWPHCLYCGKRVGGAS